MGGGADLAKLNGEQNCGLGMVAGCCCKAINYPLLSWKNSVQQGLGVSLNPAVVYRGLPMAMLNLGGTTAVQFGTTGFFQRALGSVASKDDAEMGGAFLGGLASGVPCSVWELTMIQQQRFGGGLVLLLQLRDETHVKRIPQRPLLPVAQLQRAAGVAQRAAEGPQRVGGALVGAVEKGRGLRAATAPEPDGALVQPHRAGGP